MLTQAHVRRIREHLLPKAAPLLSLYLDVNPAHPNNRNRAYLLRAREAMEAVGTPPGVVRRVLDALQDVPQARCRVVFATPEELECYDLQVELPLFEGVEAHWGEPYLTPLLYLLDEYDRVGVVFLDSERLRVFEVYLGEIEELTGAFRAVDPQVWRRLTQDSPGRRYGPGRAHRAAADTDRFARRMEAWTHRFYKAVAEQLEQLSLERNLQRLVLIGQRAEVSVFKEMLPRRLREQVVAVLPSLPNAQAQASEVLKLVEEVLGPIEHEREARLLDEVAERGVAGLEQTLEFLQQGRLYLLVLPWRLEGSAYQATDGWVSSCLESARAHGEPVREVALRRILPELAAAYGTRLEFVRGPAEERLEKLGGLAGLPRW
ncbi:MAG: VLRF1 family aeRF1-type release factor [Meiothermus sp.]|uniref:VLRF1 family aeRF1-type release factor n=1 Tax=Meiothermus sp. TaxID=1955249 RepID=UPI0025D3A8C5|nr:VLRF1 family aeRF1-type release factor [Meiothermus sp.]MCS7058592.1 VLRF1 family aeRF1-type release factor [Meiothermus sp.]MCS7193773.1 VLRF1 family aeRF1-type release factor [Meiothermus sp.]MCX7739656.1 VLRF1 family aeRF1-type release factor [Meiothermus sp.]MDW8091635.1 VLRF1 family aeRF1-type release factor [Meiothermus sp.]MDW8481951.1 VLRF1 family aeRF1-type release factor [Meiothermus sp.]